MDTAIGIGAVVLAGAALAGALLVRRRRSRRGQGPGALGLDRKAFTARFVAGLEEALPGCRASETGPLEVEARCGEAKASFLLANAYAEAVSEPQALASVLRRRVLSAIDALRGLEDETIDLDRVVPVVRDAGYPARAAENDRDAGGDSDAPPHAEALNERLVVLYAEDAAHNLYFLRSDEVEHLGLDPAALRARSVANLHRMLPAVEVHGSGAVHYLLTAGGTYEASLLLFDDLWESGRLDVRGDPVVAVPSRDVVLVTGSEDEAGIRRLREKAREVEAMGQYVVTTDLFVRRAGRWEVLPDPGVRAGRVSGAATGAVASRRTRRPPRASPR